MQYIFDFDHTLFDTERFIEDATPYHEQGLWLTPRIWHILNASDYLYEDTVSFLNDLPAQSVTILTAWTPTLGPESYEFQATKVATSGVGEPRHRVVIMEGDKGPVVRDLSHGASAVFVDDRIDHLQSARALCHTVQVVQMVRPGVVGLAADDTIPRVTCLNDINKLIQA